MSDLFTWAESRPTGQTLRDAGAGLAAEAQEDASPGWGDRAFRAISAAAAMHPTVHVDDIRAVFPDQPAHPNAWGPVWMRAIREGLIERSGEYRQTSDRKKHAHVYPIYRSLLWGVA